jgi:hypothetical protein
MGCVSQSPRLLERSARILRGVAGTKQLRTPCGRDSHPLSGCFCDERDAGVRSVAEAIGVKGEISMLNMSSWPVLRLDVLDEIHLDPRNVRLETATLAIEADILEDLFVNENVLGIVEGIAKIGYLIHEMPIVVKRRSKYVVVEGNRRLAALKVIQNPMLVPEYQSRVSRLSSQISNRASLRKIDVRLAPNQSQAEQLIAALHTANLRRAWSPARQAAFFQAQIDAGRTYKQLLSRYPLADVRRFVYRAHMVNAFKGADYSEPALEDFLSSKKWSRSLSALARVFESKEWSELTGYWPGWPTPPGWPASSCWRYQRCCPPRPRR